MRNIILALLLFCAVPMMAQDYYDPQVVDTAKALTKNEQRQIEHERKLAEREKHKHHCYCPYQKSTTVWHDIWNDGIVGTTKAVYQSTVKPQVLGEVVGAVQGAANDAPVPAIVGKTAVALGISEVHKSRRHHRNRQPPQAGRACDCNPCPYHGQRYKPNQGLHQ